MTVRPPRVRPPYTPKPPTAAMLRLLRLCPSSWAPIPFRRGDAAGAQLRALAARGALELRWGRDGQEWRRTGGPDGG